MKRGAGRKPPSRGRGQERGAGLEHVVVGRHAVSSVLESCPEIAQRLYLLSGGKGLEELTAQARAMGVAMESSSRPTLDERAGGLVHQGAVLTTRGFPYASLEEVIAGASADELVLALDGVEDVGNLGAAARAAHALGATTLLIPKDRAAPVTAAAHKSAAGALFRLRVIRAENFRRALDELKEAGFWIYGAEADGEAAPWEVDLKGKVCLIVGGEDRGLRRLTRDVCDGVVSIPMAAPDVSLNAADAATVLLYEVLRQRRIAGA
jgi:23S rRNA (guanosine2251-2'-O)-methyltransferase